MEQTRGVENKATVEIQERENKALSQSSDSRDRGEDVEEHKKNKDLQDCWEPKFLNQTRRKTIWCWIGIALPTYVKHHDAGRKPIT